jgi:integrase
MELHEPILIRTWGQALDFTFKTRHTWRHGGGAESARIYSNYFTDLFGRSYPVKRINQATLTGAAIDLEEQGLSNSSINRFTTAVRTVLSHCHEEGLLDTPPPKFKRRKESEYRVQWYSKDQVEQLAAAALDPYEREDLHDIILFAAYTGARQGEIMKIKARDILLGENKIWIGGLPDVDTKGKNCRWVPIHERIRVTITRRVEMVNSQTKIFGDEWSHRSTLMRNFAKVRRFIGIDDDRYVFHTLRHSFATWLCEAGVPLLHVKEMLGHKNIETTLRYSKVSNRALDQAMASI